MKSSTWILAVLLMVVPTTSARADDWSVPDCDRITGTNAVTFTTDDGLTLAETRRLMATFYTYGLEPLDVGGTLLASTMTTSGTAILRSEDAGCQWSLLERLPVDELLLLEAGPGGVAYGWSRGRPTFYRIEDRDVVTLSGPANLYGLAVDPADAAHIRVGTQYCQLYESFDGGASFAPLGEPGNSGNTTIFTVEFDPADLDHALCGVKGAYRTTNAGRSWAPIEPFDLKDIDLVHKFVFSPSDSRRVWARANLDTMNTNTREILVSDNGGATFVSAIVQGETVRDQNGTEWTVMLSNQPTMAAHPANPDLLYFTWTAVSCCPYMIEGENLCLYDARDDEAGVVHIPGLIGIDSIAFNPAASDVIYLGLESEKIPGN